MTCPMQEDYPKSDKHYEKQEGFSVCACIGPMYGEPLCPCQMAQGQLPMSVAHAIAAKQGEKELRAFMKDLTANWNKENTI